MLHREQRRLQRAFAAALLAALPTAALAEACGGDDAADASAAIDAAIDSSPDVSVVENEAATAPDAGADAGVDADAAPTSYDANTGCGAIIQVLEAGPDGDSPCAIALPCGLTPHTVAFGCELFHEEPDDGGFTDIGCRVLDDAGCTNDAATFVDGGYIGTVCMDCPNGSGRGTEGIAPLRALRAPSTLAAYFAQMAHGEAASVVAFQRLAWELGRHGAPAELQRAALRAARDEVAHAEAMAGCARAAGCEAPVVEASAAARDRSGTPRTLFAMAVENAVEGCIRETFGALVLAHQARSAPQPLARIWKRLARDERKHAALAWSLARFFADSLSELDRQRLAQAQQHALDEMRAELVAKVGGPREMSSQDSRALGLPGPVTTLRLFDGLFASAAGLRIAA